MNVAGSFILGLSLTVLTFSVAGATTLATASNPYSAIPERNVFALVPIPVATPVDPETLKDPPPKITPNGTMNLFGQMQVLFKVAVKPLPGQPAKDQSYVMAEGERQDDITVVKINAEAGIITFNNHGKIQELPLAEAPKGSVGSVPAPVVNPNPGAIPAPTGATPATAAAMAARLRARGASAAPAPEAAPSLSPAVTTATAGAAPAKETLTPEEQAILIEAQRAVWKEQGNKAAAILPPTKSIIGDIDPGN